MSMTLTPMPGQPAHVDVYLTGVAKCFRCGWRLAYWEDSDELTEWIERHKHDDDDE